MELAARPGQLNLDEVPAWGSRSVDNFVTLEHIGEGTYGQVYMARDKTTQEIVALKRVRMDNEKEGFPITAIREIKLLKKLQHENVIKLKEIVTSQGMEREEAEKGHEPSAEKSADNLLKGSIYMVFEYMDHDLTGLIDQPGIKFSIPQIKCYMMQLLTGLHYCHINQVLHRDIKGSNLLIDNHGILKLADFGLARSYSADCQQLTNRVITLWYRPPELLLGSQKYTQAVDMWSVGCIFAELLLGKPVFQGKTEPDQLSKILEVCGSYDEVIWPGVSKLPEYNKFKNLKHYKRKFKETFKNFDRNALDLVERMLTMDPAKRITASEALDAEYFWTDPPPCKPESLPRYETSHEFQTKKKRQQHRQQQQEEMAKRMKMHHQQPHLPPVPAAFPPRPPNGRAGHNPGAPAQGPPYPQQQYGWGGGRGGPQGGGQPRHARQNHGGQIGVQGGGYLSHNRGPNGDYGGPMPMHAGPIYGAHAGMVGQVGRPAPYGVPGPHNAYPQGEYYAGNMGRQPGPSQGGRGQGPR